MKGSEDIMELWNHMNYTSDISYLNNVFIYEMDIAKANINVLRTKNIIDQATYDYLFNSERMVRQVFVGKLQKDKHVSDALKTGILEAKKILFEANDIKDYEVLSIKNDAIFLINRIPKIRDFGLIHFVPKNKYTGFYKVRNFEFYYFYNKIDKEEYLHVKGLSDKVIELHKDHFYQFLKDLFYTIQCNGIDITIRMLKDFYMQYINLQLPVEYYRRFDVSNDYHLKVKTSIGTGFSLDNITEDAKPLLDISSNLNILLELQKILVNMYFVKYK